MTTAADVIAALNQRRQRKSLRPEVPGQLPPGWQGWLDAQPRVDAHAPGAPAPALVDALAQRPLRAIPRSPAMLGRWAALGSLLRQEWTPDLREERRLRIGVSVADIVVAVENHKPGEEAVPAASQMVSMTGSLWTAFNARVLEYLQSVTLRDLVAEQLARGVQVESPVVARTKLARRPVPLMARAGVPNSVFALGAMPVLARK